MDKITPILMILLWTASVSAALTEEFPPYEEATDITSYVSGGTFSNEYYVAPWGCDSTGDGSFANPWRTLSGPTAQVTSDACAETVVTAGDIIYLRGGTYPAEDAAQNNIIAASHFNIWERPDDSFGICNIHGTADNKIVITNYPGEVPVFEGGYDQPSFSIHGNHVVVSNLTFTSGGAIFRNSANSIIQDCKFGRGSRICGDQINNISLVYRRYSDNFTARNNYFGNSGGHAIKEYQDAGANSGARLIYNIIEGNTASYGSVCVKGLIQDMEIAYNRFYNCSEGISIGTTYDYRHGQGLHEMLDIHHNSFDDVDQFIFEIVNNACETHNVTFNGNLIINASSADFIHFDCDGGCVTDGSGTLGEFYDNIIFDVGDLIHDDGDSSSNYPSYLNYNAYSNTSLIGTAENVTGIGSENWQADSLIISNLEIFTSVDGNDRSYFLPDDSVLLGSGRYGGNIGGFASEDIICEAPNGYDCWYVSLNGSDSNIGSFENPYRTVQYAIDNMGGGDYIYLREGIYDEKWLYIPNELSGSAGSPTTIKSYPGEWAVIDGQHDCFTTSGVGRDAAAVFILQGGTEHVSFENLEITGGGYPHNYQVGGDGTAAIRAWDSARYITVKGCYIHNNTAGNGGGNPAGIYAKTPINWTMSFNHFENNGCPPDVDHGNCVSSAVFIGQRDFFTEGGAMRNNEFSYNLVEGGKVAYKHKHVQFFGPLLYDNSNYSWRDWGDKIHHNIFRPDGGTAVGLRQDFVNVYNNIMDFSNSTRCGNGWGAIHIQDFGAPGGDDQKVHKYLFYNNQVINPLYGGVTMAGYAAPHSWVYGNIIENNDNFWMNAENREINIRNGAQDQEVDLTDCVIDRNYIFRPQDTDHFLLSGTPEKISTSEFNSMYSAQNHVNSTSRQLLYLEGYITDPFHKVGTGTLSDSGIGGNHPYLDGVDLPSYVGAVNPDDHSWVDGVLNLSDTGFLSDIDDPSWVEGDDAQDYHDADLDADNIINSTEMRHYVSGWLGGHVLLADLSGTLGIWKGGGEY